MPTARRCAAAQDSDIRGLWRPLLSALAVSLFLGLALSTVAGCSKDITGHYLSEKGYVRIQEENDQTLLERWPNRYYADDRKPDIVLSLRRDGKKYIGSIAGFMGAGEMVVSRNDDGIFLVGMGKKESYREIDFEAGNSELPDEFVLAELSKDLIESSVAKLKSDDLPRARLPQHRQRTC